MSTTMKAAQISKAGGDWELSNATFQSRVSGQVRVKLKRAYLS